MRVLEKIVPALVILDVMMPGIDGIQILQWIRGHDGLTRLPVLMYTADQSPEIENEALRCGAQGFLVKGRVLFGDLLGAVGKHATARPQASAAKN
jgi:CheY-like chemotaxis protein